jgi:hypothetical protein
LGYTDVMKQQKNTSIIAIFLTLSFGACGELQELDSVHAENNEQLESKLTSISTAGSAEAGGHTSIIIADVETDVISEEEDDTCIALTASRFLSSNRHHGLQRNTLQVATHYDGSGEASLTIELESDEGCYEHIQIDGIEDFGRSIQVFEYDLPQGVRISRCFIVDDVRANGVIDGLAFGMLLKKEDGGYELIRSENSEDGRLNFVGIWPLAGSNFDLSRITPSGQDSFAVEQIRGMLTGARQLDNGRHCF